MLGGIRGERVGDALGDFGVVAYVGDLGDDAIGLGCLLSSFLADALLLFEVALLLGDRTLQFLLARLGFFACGIEGVARVARGIGDGGESCFGLSDRLFRLAHRILRRGERCLSVLGYTGQVFGGTLEFLGGGSDVGFQLGSAHAVDGGVG